MGGEFVKAEAGEPSDNMMKDKTIATHGPEATKHAGVVPERVPPMPKSTSLPGTEEASSASGASDHEDVVPSSSKKSLPSEIVVYHDWCKACGICIEFCPTRVFDRRPDGHPDIARPGKCVSCDLCELLCPDFAITLTRPTGD